MSKDHFTLNSTNTIYHLPWNDGTGIPKGIESSDYGYDMNPTKSVDLYGNTTNGSALLERDENTAMDWVRDIALGVVLALLSLLTFVGNAMVLHAVRTERRLQSVSNMFIVSLAIADLIVGLIVMPISATYIFTVDWMFGVGVCQFWIGVDYTASTASILNLFILSLDRYWSVTSPLRYIRQRTKRRALVMISLVWFVSSLWLIPIIGWHYFEHDGIRTVPSDVCDTEYATNTALKIVTGLLNFYLPLGIMYSLYGKIFMEIKRRSKLELGQRIAGGMITPEPYITTSLSDDSDEKQYVDSIPLKNHISKPLPQNGKDLVDRQISNISYRQHTDLDTDTECTDDEVARLNKSGYTSMKLMSEDLDKAQNPRSQDCSSDSDYKRLHYVYDESVLESTTEKVHRYYYEHKPLLKQNCSNSCQPFPDNKNIETTKNYVDTEDQNGNGRVRFQVDSLEHKKDKVALPKETHPAKNTYVVKPRCYRNTKLSTSSEPEEGSPKLKADSQIIGKKSVNGSHRKLHRTHNHINHNLRHSSQNSALVKQAMKWRKRVDKKKHKPSSALSKEIKAARQLGVIMGAFTVCFLPYFVCFMVVAFCDNCVDGSLMTAVTWVGYLNSTLNPFLYPLCNANFRRKFREMLNLSQAQDWRRNSTYYQHHRHMSVAGNTGAYDNQMR